MPEKRMRLADIAIERDVADVIEDQRGQLGYVLVRCPHDDGTDDHALYLCNPVDGLPAQAYCLSEKCRNINTRKFLALLGIAVDLH